MTCPSIYLVPLFKPISRAQAPSPHNGGAGLLPRPPPSACTYFLTPYHRYLIPIGWSFCGAGHPSRGMATCSACSVVTKTFQNMTMMMSFFFAKIYTDCCNTCCTPNVFSTLSVDPISGGYSNQSPQDGQNKTGSPPCLHIYLVMMTVLALSIVLLRGTYIVNRTKYIVGKNR